MALEGTRAYFSEGRCSGHAQFNGRYCRDVAGPEQWCIHCAGYMLAAELRRMDWQPISTAPKDGAGYLVYPTPLFGADQAGVGYWDRDEGYECWRDLEGERMEPQPTHWQPLPSPPEVTP